MRYCGNCGASFEPDTLTDGRCPNCGAAISNAGDVSGFDTLAVAGPVRHSASDAGGGLSASSGTPPVMVRVDPQNVVVLEPRPPRSGTNLALTLLALLALLLLIGGAAVIGVRWGQSQASARQPTAPTSGAATAAAQPSTSPTTPSGTAVAASATPNATQTQHATQTQPSLTVAPTQIALSPCVATSAQFQVRNDGGGSLTWTANTSNSLYRISPSSGALGHDDAQTVRVTDITLSGQITITAPGAANAPQTVTITCS